MKIHVFQVGQGESAPPDGVEILSCDLQGEWGMYQAVRVFFQEAVEDDALYAFVLPSFWEETGLDLPAMSALVQQAPASDVHVMWPFRQQAAAFLSAFELAEFQRTGFMEILEEFMSLLGMKMQPAKVHQAMSEITTANYVLAKPVFWQTWFSLAERACEVVQFPTLALAAELQKVDPVSGRTTGLLLVEWLASVVLALDRELVVHGCDLPALKKKSADLESLIARRAAFLATGEMAALDAFYEERNAVLTEDVVDMVNQQAVSRGANAALNVRQGLVYGCTGPDREGVVFPAYVHRINTKEAVRGQLDSDVYAPQWQPYKSVIPSLVGLFAFKNYVRKQHPGAQHVGVCSTEMFVSAHKISGAAPSADMPMVDDVMRGQLPVGELASLMQAGAAELLVSAPATMTLRGQEAGYLSFYASSRHHNVEDLLHFTSLAVELRILAPQDVALFFAEKMYYVGGISYGVYPAQFWLNTIDMIESIVWECVHRYPEVRQEQQKPAWAYCADFFGSYALLNYLRQNNTIPSSHGQLNRIT